MDVGQFERGRDAIDVFAQRVLRLLGIGQDDDPMAPGQGDPR